MNIKKINSFIFIGYIFIILFIINIWLLVSNPIIDKQEMWCNYKEKDTSFYHHCYEVFRDEIGEIVFPPINLNEGYFLYFTKK